MKILYIHNNYANNNSGEEHAAEGIVSLLKANGHEVDWYRRSSADLTSPIKKISSFFTGIWNPAAVKALKKKLDEFQPDIVQVQNLYPLISPAILKTIKKRGIPIVMRCPNYRLFCPNGLHLDNKGKVCEKCLSGGRELNCILKNCEKKAFKSWGYAIRNFTARIIWGILKYPDNYIVQSKFQKAKFIKNGIPGHKITIVPGLTPDIRQNGNLKSQNLVSFVGRVSLEKGIEEFIEAAKHLPEISFAVAGSVSPSLSYLREKSPANIIWTGYLKGQKLDDLYQQSQIIIIPGKWYEGFPNVITRAMKHGKPVITSKLGAMASIIDHEVNGLLVEPGSSTELGKAIQKLHQDPQTCLQYGMKGKQKAEENYSSEKIYTILNQTYNSLLSSRSKRK